MKPRRRPAAGSLTGSDDDALADLCVLLIDAVQIPDVALALAEAISPHLLPPGSTAPVRHSPPARGRRH